MFTLAIDQSTSATKLMLFDEHEQLCHRVTLEHAQYYPQPGWVEHDAEEIMQNIFQGAAQLLRESGVSEKEVQSVALTNQRETVVVWEAATGRPGNRLPGTWRSAIWPGSGKGRRTRYRCTWR